MHNMYRINVNFCDQPNPGQRDKERTLTLPEIPPGLPQRKSEFPVPETEEINYTEIEIIVKP